MKHISMLSIRGAAQTAILACAVVLVSALAGPAADIVDHPEKLKFKDLDYRPPKPADRRAVGKGRVGSRESDRMVAGALPWLALDVVR